MSGVDVESDFAPHTIAVVNRRAVLDALERMGTPCSISDLVRLTTLSRPTVSTAVVALHKAGAVAMDEPSTSTPRGGRPSRRYRLATDSSFVLSGTIGPRELYAQAADLEGRVLVERRVPITIADLGDDEVLDHIMALLHEVDTELAVHGGALASIALSVLGIVRHGTTVILSDTLPMLHGTVLYDRVTAAFAVPVLIENDANCAALAEAAERPSVNTMIGLLAGQILGCGIVLKGRLHRGANGAAGELTSAEWSDLLALLQTPGDSAQILQTFTAAGEGEPAAVAFTEEVAVQVAQLLRPAVEFLDPDLVVIGGEAAAAGIAFTVPFRRELEKTAGWAPEVDVTSLADRTVVAGVHILGARYAYAELMGRDQEQIEPSRTTSPPSSNRLGVRRM